MSESLSSAMSILDTGVLRMSSGASQPSGGWSCSVVRWYGSRYFYIFCPMAAGWTDGGGGGCCFIVSTSSQFEFATSSWIFKHSFITARMQRSGIIRGKNGIGTSLVLKRLHVFCGIKRAEPPFINNLHQFNTFMYCVFYFFFFFKKRKGLFLLLNVALWWKE